MTRCFINELGNEIFMSVVRDERGITVIASSSVSEVEHTWTPKEVEILHDLLGEVLYP